MSEPANQAAGRVSIRFDEGQGQKTRIVVGDPLSPSFVDEAYLADATQRERILGAIVEKCPGLEREAVERHLVTEAARIKPSRRAERERSARPSPDPEAAKSTESDLAEAREILASGDLLAQVERDLAGIGIEGERDLRLAIYLLGTSRTLPKPLHAIIRGHSSAGKSFVAERVARLFPPEAIVEATHLTPKALYYMEDLSHRWLVLGERSRNEGPEAEDATKAIREMQSSGRVSIRLPGENGTILAKVVEGPIASTASTTMERIFEEDANRCLLLWADESEEQNRAIKLRQARDAAGATEDDYGPIAARHRAMQRIIAEGMPHRVAVPFAERIGLPTDRIEIRRVFPCLLGTIRASAVLHRLRRAVDPDGRIVATVDDYALARRVVGPAISSALASSPTDAARRLAEAIAGIVEVGADFTQRDLADRLGLPKPRINERLRELGAFGMVELAEEARGPNPARWRLLKPSLPAFAHVLPDPEALR